MKEQMPLLFAPRILQVLWGWTSIVVAGIRFASEVAEETTRRSYQVASVALAPHCPSIGITLIGQNELGRFFRNFLV